MKQKNGRERKSYAQKNKLLFMCERSESLEMKPKRILTKKEA